MISIRIEFGKEVSCLDNISLLPPEISRLEANPAVIPLVVHFVGPDEQVAVTVSLLSG